VAGASLRIEQKEEGKAVHEGCNVHRTSSQFRKPIVFWVPLVGLAEQVDIGVAAWTGVDYGRKIAGEIKGVAAIIEAEAKAKLQNRFGLANSFPSRLSTIGYDNCRSIATP
jgi:hypothetical protein